VDCYCLDEVTFLHVGKRITRLTVVWVIPGIIFKGEFPE
jgi:hypothetical protein